MKHLTILLLILSAFCAYAAPPVPLYVGHFQGKGNANDFVGDGTGLSNVTSTAMSTNTINIASSPSIGITTNSPTLNTPYLQAAVTNDFYLMSTNESLKATQNATNNAKLNANGIALLTDVTNEATAAAASKISISGGTGIGNTLSNLTIWNGTNNGLAFTSPGSGLRSEQFGSGAVASGVNATALGSTASATNTDATALGRASLADAASTAIGSSAVAFADGVNGSTAIGFRSTSRAPLSVSIGGLALVAATHTNSMAMGVSATTTAAHQIMLGTATENVNIPGELDMVGNTNWVSGNLTVAGTTSNNVLNANSVVVTSLYANLATSTNLALGGISTNGAANGNVPTIVAGNLAWQTPSGAGTWTGDQNAGGLSLTNISQILGTNKHELVMTIPTNTIQYGLILTNTSPATNTGIEGYSPALLWAGNGRKTAATAASMPVAFQAYVLPADGSAAPTAKWTLNSSVNGGAFGNTFSVDTAGATIVAGSLTVAAGLSIGSLVAGSVAGGTGTPIRNSASTASGPITFGYSVVAKTADWTNGVYESSTIYANTGASAAITNTLPTIGALYIGAQYRYIVDSAQILAVRTAPGSTDTIQYGGATAQTIQYSSTSNAVLRVFALKAGTWIADIKTGTWAP